MQVQQLQRSVPLGCQRALQHNVAYGLLNSNCRKRCATTTRRVAEVQEQQAEVTQTVPPQG